MILYPDAKETYSLLTTEGRLLAEDLSTTEEVKVEVHKALAEGYTLEELRVKTEDLIFDQVSGSWQPPENRGELEQEKKDFYI